MNVQEAQAYKLDYDVTEQVFAKLNGHHGNAIKLMVVLLGNDDSVFALTELAQRTGMNKAAAVSALGVLERKGMIERNGDVIKLRIDKLAGDKTSDSRCRSKRIYTSSWSVLSTPRDKALRKMLGEIGMNYVERTKICLEEAAGEEPDLMVLEEIIKAHPEAWTEEERKTQNYYFATLCNLVTAEYRRRKKKLMQEPA